jgi:hypothetical protein
MILGRSSEFSENRLFIVTKEPEDKLSISIINCSEGIQILRKAMIN